MPNKTFSESPLMKFLPADAQAKPETAKPAAAKPQITRQVTEYKAAADFYEPRSRRVQLLMRPSIYTGIQYIAQRRKQSANNLIETVLAEFIAQTKAEDEQTKKG
jgi:hypothetical protein